MDGQTAAQYAVHLDERLADLLERVRTQRYVAPPVRRVHIPKDGGTRPIGIPTFEDKVLQRAVAMVLEAVCEQEFLDCSYGFRPGRSAHQALDAFWHQTMAMGGGWVLELDIRSYFDTLDHAHLRDIIEQRVRDGRLLRLIGKWLHAGVLADRRRWYPEAGTPQGGVISPVLANTYLHTVLDVWFERFAREDDARRVLEVLPKRFGKYGLTLHPEKTRLVRFVRPRGGDGPRPGTFDLLGFTHYWGVSRKGAPSSTTSRESGGTASRGAPSEPVSRGRASGRSCCGSSRCRSRWWSTRPIAQRSRDPRSRMREIRTSGSVGGGSPARCGRAAAYPTFLASTPEHAPPPECRPIASIPSTATRLSTPRPDGESGWRAGVCRAARGGGGQRVATRRRRDRAPRGAGAVARAARGLGA